MVAENPTLVPEITVWKAAVIKIIHAAEEVVGDMATVEAIVEVNINICGTVGKNGSHKIMLKYHVCTDIDINQYT